MSAAGLHFRRLTPDDAALLKRWRAMPHVVAWWGDDTDDDEGPEAENAVTRWIVAWDGVAFAYLQDYRIHEWPGHHLGFLPAGSRGIDQFIGEPEMLGRGLGTALIRQHLATLFDSGVPAVGTDPHPHNLRAVAVYKKVGFVPVGLPVTTPWGHVQPMAHYGTIRTPYAP